jgi:hypothetical protein
MSHGKRKAKRRNSKSKGRTKALTALGVAALSLAGGASQRPLVRRRAILRRRTRQLLSMRKKSPTLVCRLSMSLTTKTPEHVVLAYNLPRGRAVDRGKVAEAAQQTIAQAEVPHAAQPALPAAEAHAHDAVTDGSHHSRFAHELR